MSQKDSELKQWAKAWMHYISVATLASESATTRRGTEDAIRGYDNVWEDFTNSIEHLLKTRTNQIIEELKQLLEDIKNDRNPDESTLKHFKDAQDGKRSMTALLNVLIANEYYRAGEDQVIKEVTAILEKKGE